MPNTFQRAMLRVAKGLFGVEWGVPGADTWQFAQDWVKGLMPSSGGLEEPYREQATVAIAIGTIAEDAASVEWEMFPDGDDDALETHPVLDLFENPAKMWTANDFFTATYVARQLFGEAFWYYPDLIVGRPGSTRTMAANRGGLSLLDSRAVRHKISGGEVSWALRVNGEDMPLDSDALTWFRRPNPYGFRGLSKVEAVLADAKGDHAAANWNERFFSEQNGIPSGTLTPASGSMLTADQKTELHRTWNQRHGGTKRALAVLPAGWVYNQMGLSQQDMGFRELREYSREQILAMFGVPPFIAGVLDKANYANAREQKEVYWQGTISRFLKGIQATLQGDFLPSVGVEGLRIAPKWTAIRAFTENLAEKVTTGKELFAMGVPMVVINERLELGLDADQIPNADVGYLPMNLMPSTMLDEPRTVAGPVEDKPEPDPDEEDEKGFNARETRRTLVWRAITDSVRDIEILFQRAMRSHFESIKQEVLDNLDGVKGRAWIGGNVLKANVDEWVFDVEKANWRLLKKAKPLHKRALARGGRAVIAQTHIGISFDLLDIQVLAKLAEMAYHIIKGPDGLGINGRLEHKLRMDLIEGLQAGESLFDLRDRVVHRLDVSQGRALTIARTETGFGFNAGRNLGMRQAGIKRHEWLSSRDPDVRDSHMAEDGNPAAVGEPFPVTGLLYPQDSSGPPGEVINCRCVALPIVE